MTIEHGPATYGLETKFVSLAALEAAGEDGRVAGYASLFGAPDQGGDIVQPGAFTASLDALRLAGRRVKFLWQHDPAQPIGVWDEVLEDRAGLRVAGRILSGVARGADAIQLMAAGAIDGLSIGYRTVRASANPETGGRLLHEIDLWEVSLVTFPLLPTARASMAERAPAQSFAEALAEALAET